MRLSELAYNVFNTESGQELIGLLVDSYLFSNAYDNGSDTQTHVNLGKQQVIKDLWSASQVSPAKIMDIVKRHNEREVI